MLTISLFSQERLLSNSFYDTDWCAGFSISWAGGQNECNEGHSRLGETKFRKSWLLDRWAPIEARICRQRCPPLSIIVISAGFWPKNKSRFVSSSPDRRAENWNYNNIQNGLEKLPFLVLERAVLVCILFWSREVITLRCRDTGILEKEVKRRNTALLFVTVEKQASFSVAYHASYLLLFS